VLMRHLNTFRKTLEIALIWQSLFTEKLTNASIRLRRKKGSVSQTADRRSGRPWTDDTNDIYHSWRVARRTYIRTANARRSLHTGGLMRGTWVSDPDDSCSDKQVDNHHQSSLLYDVRANATPPQPGQAGGIERPEPS